MSRLYMISASILSLGLAACSTVTEDPVAIDPNFNKVIAYLPTVHMNASKNHSAHNVEASESNSLIDPNFGKVVAYLPASLDGKINFMFSEGDTAAALSRDVAPAQKAMALTLPMAQPFKNSMGQDHAENAQLLEAFPPLLPMTDEK